MHGAFRRIKQKNRFKYYSTRTHNTPNYLSSVKNEEINQRGKIGTIACDLDENGCLKM